ncbi:MAG: SUMF1/EgtB/PvdO family nonheme iron enzyme [Rhodospirillaceae bacterium]|nr:SUMF1/EgtB/PvdO family nonheme iron enzyme [Rhodospirillaceae bacterium]
MVDKKGPTSSPARATIRRMGNRSIWGRTIFALAAVVVLATLNAPAVAQSFEDLLGPDYGQPEYPSRPAPVPGQTFRDCPACPEMVAIQSGTMPNPPTIVGGRVIDDDAPVTYTSIGRFALARTEVTVQQYATFVAATGHRSADQCSAWTNAVGREIPVSYDPSLSLNWQNPGFSQGQDHPVVCVSWDDAQAYAQWLSNLTSQSYRLPTEAEVEYSSSLETYFTIFFAETVCPGANIPDQSAEEYYQGWELAGCQDGFSHTSPVHQFDPDFRSLYDIAGNVREWTEDCWNGQMFRYPSETARPSLEGDCSQRMPFGVSWAYRPLMTVRTMIRFPWSSTTGLNDIGFRVARDY